jgi:threonine/homoserine/homoserine lactone efflux protein
MVACQRVIPRRFERHERWVMDEISMYLPGIALAYSAFLLGIASPGPNVLAVIGTSMGDGRRSGTALALGIAAGSFCWALLTASGLSALLSSYASALTMIKITGGLYLLWLAYKALQSATAAQDIVPTSLAVSGRGALRYVIRGFTIQMTNPKAALAWIAIISLGFTKTHRPGSDSPLSGVPPFSRPSFTAFMQSRFRRPQWCASTSGQGDGSRRHSAPFLPSQVSGSSPPDSNSKAKCFGQMSWSCRLADLPKTTPSLGASESRLRVLCHE